MIAPTDPGATPPDRPDDTPDGGRDGGPELSGPGPAAPAEGGAVELAVMRARLAAMAAPRDDDDPEVAALRAALRDARLMTQVMATVEQWPPLTEEQPAFPMSGKTSLAVHWAHRLRHGFPDGALFTNMRGYSSDDPS